MGIEANTGITFDLNDAIDKITNLYKSKKIIIHQEPGILPYLTIKDNPNGDIKYCAVCFGYEGKFVPTMDNGCLICSARNKEKINANN